MKPTGPRALARSGPSTQSSRRGAGESVVWALRTDELRDLTWHQLGQLPPGPRASKAANTPPASGQRTGPLSRRKWATFAKLPTLRYAPRSDHRPAPARNRRTKRLARPHRLHQRRPRTPARLAEARRGYDWLVASAPSDANGPLVTWDTARSRRPYGAASRTTKLPSCRGRRVGCDGSGQTVGGTSSWSPCILSGRSFDPWPLSST